MKIKKKKQFQVSGTYPTFYNAFHCFGSILFDLKIVKQNNK